MARKSSLEGRLAAVLSAKLNRRGLTGTLVTAALVLGAAIEGLRSLTLQGHTAAVLSVAFSPDGQRLASASTDQTVKVWEVSRGSLKSQPRKRNTLPEIQTQ